MRREATVSLSPPFRRGGAARGTRHPLPNASPRGGTDARVGVESQGIAVKGLLCPLRYPGSDLGNLPFIFFSLQNGSSLADETETEIVIVFHLEYSLLLFYT